VRRRWKAAALVLVAVGGILAIFSGLENRLLYFPTRELAATPEAYGLRAEELSLPSEDGVVLHGWRIPGDGKRALLFFHGNAGNAADRLERARILNRRFGLDVFLVDYRGYGRSTGSPSEEGLYRDARTIYEAARERGFSPDRILAFGESLGSAVAVELATEKPCAAIILETPFLSVPAMARVHYPLVPRFLVRTRFDNAARIQAIRAPKLFLVAGRDEIAPPEQGRDLFERASEPKTLFVIPNAGHNDTYATGGEAYWREWERFLASLP
jgi:fermentation-respiration switch protein FrsA (DUF1100 family)